MDPATEDKNLETMLMFGPCPPGSPCCGEKAEKNTEKVPEIKPDKPIPHRGIAHKTFSPYGVPLVYCPVSGAHTVQSPFKAMQDEQRNSNFSRVLRAISTAAPIAKEYATSIEGLPDTFVLFSIVEKLMLLNASLKAAALLLFNEEVATCSMGDSIEAAKCRQDITELFASNTILINRMKDVSINMSRPAPVAGVRREG